MFFEDKMSDIEQNSVALLDAMRAKGYDPDRIMNLCVMAVSPINAHFAAVGRKMAAEEMICVAANIAAGVLVAASSVEEHLDESRKLFDTMLDTLLRKNPKEKAS
jgi:hypothetical protein